MGILTPDIPSHSPPRQRKSEPTPVQGSGPSSRHRSARPEKEDPKTIGPWRIGKTIGKGSSGRVKIAKHRETGGYAAVKIVPKHALLSSRMSLGEAGAKQDKMLLGIEREIVIMKLIEHPNVLQLYDVWETGSELYLIMEYVEGGELFDYLVSKGRLQEDEALHYFQQLISGVDYCHRFNICHRDLKPENLLLDRERNIKIADFGMAALEASGKLLETSCGSPHYASPEIVAGLTYHGSSSDIWSCGIILFALLTGRLPFDDENIRTLLGKVKIGKYNMPPDVPSLAKDLIRGMLVVDPTKRLTMDQITSHPWFTRRAPRPQPAFIAPPTPNQMTRPVGSRAELDPDILSNLRTLWFGASEDAIIRALISEEKCWEKVFYFLLSKYRQRHLENFNIEDAPNPHVSPKRRRQPREHVAKTATSAVKSRSRTSLVTQNRSPATVNYTRTTATTRGPTQEPHFSPPIAISSPQLPAKAAVTNDNDVFAYSKASTSTPGSRPLPPAPAQSSPIATRKAQPRPPAITLQEATPSPVTKGERHSRRSYPYPVEEPPSPSPAAITSGSSTGSRRSWDRDVSPSVSVVPASPQPSLEIPNNTPSTPIIQIPQTVDADMQRFFQDIVDQLQTMSTMRTPTLTGSPNPSVAQTPLMTPPPEKSRNISPQFEDAEEPTNDEANFEHVGGCRSASGDFVIVPESAQIPTAPPLKPRPKSVRITSGRFEPKRTTTSASRSTGKGVYMAQSNHVATSLDSNRSTGSSHSTVNKENEGSSYTSSSRRSAAATSNYGLGIQSVLDDCGALTENGDDTQQRRKSTRKVKLVTPVISSTSASPSPSTLDSTSIHTPNSPKVSWFANLFTWKSVNYQLMSVEGIDVTRNQAKRLLEASGVFVVIESTDGTTSYLKCRFDDRINGSLRPVRFRVDFTTYISNHHGSPSTTPISFETKRAYKCSISLSLEKGSASTFKSVCNALRKGWDESDTNI